MSGKSINFDNKKPKKVNFIKNRKAFKIYDIDINKVLVLKNNHMVQISQLNISLDITIMMTLDLYA